MIMQVILIILQILRSYESEPCKYINEYSTKDTQQLYKHFTRNQLLIIAGHN